jgi:hypothetical protein
MLPTILGSFTALALFPAVLAQTTGGQSVGASTWLTVDVGYGVYTGVYNTTSKLAVWRG